MWFVMGAGDDGQVYHPGRGFIFFLAALLLIILGAIDLARTFMRKRKAVRDELESPIWRGVQWQRVLLVLSI